jgi:hypothetical protein
MLSCVWIGQAYDERKSYTTGAGYRFLAEFSNPTIGLENLGCFHVFFPDSLPKILCSDIVAAAELANVSGAKLKEGQQIRSSRNLRHSHEGRACQARPERLSECPRK